MGTRGIEHSKDNGESMVVSLIKEEVESARGLLANKRLSWGSVTSESWTGLRVQGQILNMILPGKRGQTQTTWVDVKCSILIETEKVARGFG